MKEKYEGKAVRKKYRNEIINKAKKKTKPYFDAISKETYGSDAWFDARENYYNQVDKFGSDYTSALLKDYGMERVSYATKKQWGNSALPLNYADSEYRSIIDPTTGDRDYDLEEKYYTWLEKNKKE